jgi:O-antigen/teichoic acid export membrane protein
MAAPVALEQDIKANGSSPAARTARRGFLANVSSNLVFTAVQALATLWFTPFLIRHLGVGAYGMVPLVNSLVIYMAILTSAHYSTLSRFLAIELEQGDEVSANKTFNTALSAITAAFLVLTPFILLLALNFPRIFAVPTGWESDASWLFAIVALGFMITVIGNSFGVSPFIHSRFPLMNTVNLMALFARIGFVVALFTLFRPHLSYVGGGILIGALTTLAGFVLIWRRLTPELHIQIRAFDRSRLSALMGMGGWVAVNLVGAMLLARVDVVVVNLFFGAAVTGGYAAVAQLSPLIESMVNAAAGVFRPVVLIKYAQGDSEGLRRLASQAIKLLGLGLALPVGLLCGFSRPLLTIWLGPSFADFNIVLILLASHQSLNLSVRPLLDVQNAFNKVRWPGIATLLCGGASLCLAVVLAKWGRWGAAGVALAIAVSWTVKNCLYMPIYTAHIMKLPRWTLLPSLVPTALGTLFVGLASYGVTLFRMPNSWFTLAASSIVVSLAYVLVVWVLGLSRADRTLLKELVPLRSVETRRGFGAE